MRRKKHEVVVITGASAGVGRATVQRFAKHGAQIGLIARGVSGLQAAAAEVEKLGGRAFAVPADVAFADQVEAAAEKIEGHFGPIDIWINNAMTSVFSRFREMTAEEFHRVTEVTYLGAVYGTLEALKRMVPRDSGTIVQVGSALAYRSIPLQSAYCGAKHAIRGFTDSVRSELLHDRSRVKLTMVHLPAMNTPQFSWVKSRLPHQAQPVPPIYQPEVAARAIYWAAHHYRRELFVGMPTTKAVELNKIFPGLLDRILGRIGFSRQQTRALRPTEQADNLWEPLDGVNGRDFGAHGSFDSRSRSRSQQLWATEHRKFLTAIAGIVGVGLGLSFFKTRSKAS